MGTLLGYGSCQKSIAHDYDLNLPKMYNKYIDKDMPGVIYELAASDDSSIEGCKKLMQQYRQHTATC